MTTQLAQKMWDANVRIEKMFWIGGQCAGPTNDFEDFISDDLRDADEVNAALPWIKQYGGEYGAEDVLAELAFKNIDGFFVQLATPTPRDFGESGSYSFSWGSYRTEWFFFPTLEAMTERAETWAHEIVETARAKATARNGGKMTAPPEEHTPISREPALPAPPVIAEPKPIVAGGIPDSGDV